MRASVFALASLIVLMFVSTVASQPAKKKRHVGVDGPHDGEDPKAAIVSLYTFGRSGFGVGGDNALGFDDVYDVIFKRGDCKLGKDFPVEIDQGAFTASFEQFDVRPLHFFGFEAKKDLIDQCLDAVKAMERICEDGHDEAVRAAVKKLRCALLDRKPKQATAPTQALDADGTWTVSFSWWSSDDDFLGVEDGLAKTLRVAAPKRDPEMKSSIQHLQGCRKATDCKRASDTCYASNDHGPRCLPPTAFKKSTGDLCDDGSECISGACSYNHCL